MLERRNLIEMLGSRFTTLFKKYWLVLIGGVWSDVLLLLGASFKFNLLLIQVVS